MNSAATEALAEEADVGRAKSGLPLLRMVLRLKQ
jgi:hypothetical protein